MTSERADPMVAALASAVADRCAAAGFAEHARLLRTLDARGVGDGDRADDPPVLRHLDDALSRASAVPTTATIASQLVGLAPRAPWTRTSSYVTDPPHEGFLDGYAHATLAGPRDGADALTVDGVSLGLLLLGPGVHYPPHHHPADEVYLPLTPTRWLDPSGGYEPREPGRPIHHRPWQAHGMRTGDGPLLAVYLWSGDVVSPSRFC